VRRFFSDPTHLLATSLDRIGVASFARVDCHGCDLYGDFPFSWADCSGRHHSDRRWHRGWQPWRLFPLLLAVLAGSLIGESLGFLIGRVFGTRLRASKLGQRIGERNWQIADTFVETRGGIAVAISRFLPVLHSLVPVVAGMTKMRYRVFIVWTFGACAIWAGAYISLGWIAGASWDQFSGDLKWGGVIFAGIILVIAVIFTSRSSASRRPLNG